MHWIWWVAIIFVAAIMGVLLFLLALAGDSQPGDM